MTQHTIEFAEIALRDWQRDSFKTLAESHGSTKKRIESNCVGVWYVTIDGENVYEGTDPIAAQNAYNGEAK